MRSFVRLGAFALAVLALSAATASAQAAASRPQIAILDFEFGTIEHWWSGNDDIGKGISEMLTTELLDDGSFRLIERKKLDTILKEQDFANSDRAAPSEKQQAQLRKALGVKYMVTGTITKFGTENSNKSVGGGGFGSKFGVGSVGKSSGKATVAITLRVIDTTTGEIMVGAKGEATSKRSGLMLGGGGGGSGKAAMGGMNFGSSDFKDTIIGEATEAAVKQLAANLIAKKDRLK